MGKLKGKKAWRKNIDTTDVERVIEERAQDAGRPKPEVLADDQLFFIDAGGDEAPQPKSLRRRQAREDHTLHAQLIIGGSAAQAGALATAKRAKQRPGFQKPKPGTPAAVAAAEAEAAVLAAAVASRLKRKQRRATPGEEPVADIWADNGPDSPAAAWAANVSSTDLLRAGREPGPLPARPPQRGARGRRAALPPIPAVEVDAAGCSYNPEHEAHQDALAAVVAAAVKKEIREELAPRAPPQHTPEGTGAPLDPMLALLDNGGALGGSDAGGEDEQQPRQQQEEGREPEEGEDQQQQGGRRRRGGVVAAADDPNAIDLGGDGSDSGADGHGPEGEGPGQRQQVGSGSGAGLATAAMTAAAKGKKTRADRNRGTRRRAQEAEVAARTALKRQRRELDALPELQAELAWEEAERAARRLRRATVAAERAASGPPRLGKLRYVDAPPPVLTSDEVTGSLRQLAPYPMVAADRYRALQKRGVIEVRRRAGEKRKAQRVEYVTGERTEKAAAAQAEVDALRRARIKAGRKANAAAAKAAAGTGRQVLDSELGAASLGW